MEQLLKKLAGCWHESATGGDVARLELYQAITAKGLSGDDEESTSRAFERQRGAILRVLVRGKCLQVFVAIAHDRLSVACVCRPGSAGLEEQNNCNRSILRCKFVVSNFE